MNEEVKMIIESIELALGIEYGVTNKGFKGVCYILRDILSGRYTDEAKECLMGDIVVKYSEAINNMNRLVDTDYNLIMNYNSIAYMQRIIDMIYCAEDTSSMVKQLKATEKLKLNEYFPSNYGYMVDEQDIMDCFDIVQAGLGCMTSGVMSSIGIHVNAMELYSDKSGYEVDMYDVKGNVTLAISLYLALDRRSGMYNLLGAICKGIAYCILSYELEDEFLVEMGKAYPNFREKSIDDKANSLASVLRAVTLCNINIVHRGLSMTKKDLSLKGTRLSELVKNMCYNM